VNLSTQYGLAVDSILLCFNNDNNHVTATGIIRSTAADAATDERRVCVGVCSEAQRIRKLLSNYNRQEPPADGAYRLSFVILHCVSKSKPPDV